MLTQNMYYTSGVDRTGAEFVGNKQNHSLTHKTLNRVSTDTAVQMRYRAFNCSIQQ